MDQAVLNVGLLGHVAHGKSTLTKAITGISTPKFKQEKQRNITIKLGYANAKIYQCQNTLCAKYCSQGSHGSTIMTCPYCSCSADFRRHISLVDVPGHSQLMGTALNGVAVMDAALLLTAANEPCPQPQTEEHLAAIKTNQVVIVQNKVDTVSPEKCIDHFNQITNFIAGSPIQSSPIVPISAQRSMNLDIILEKIMQFQLPQRDLISPARMMIIRSFDVNKPGCAVDALVGGVAGGAMIRGQLKLGDMIEIRPGIMVRTQTNITCTPIITRVTSLAAEKNKLEVASPGGLIGVGTDMDPSLCKGDRLVGQLLGHVGSLPPIVDAMEVHVRMKKGTIPFHARESILLHIMSNSIPCTITATKADLCKLTLEKPVCCEANTKFAMSRKVNGHVQLIAFGRMIQGRVLIQ